MREIISVPKGGGGGMTEVKLRPTVLTPYPNEQGAFQAERPRSSM